MIALLLAASIFVGHPLVNVDEAAAEAGVAQLAERQPSKLHGASSNLVSRSTSHRLTGIATWLDWPGYTAAAGPALRAAGAKPGQYVRVTHAGQFVIVRLIPGGCWCPPRNGVPVLLDLSRTAFRKLTNGDPFGVGTIDVTVQIGIRVPKPPATDTVK